MERRGIGRQCGGAPTSSRLLGVAGVRRMPNNEGALTKSSPVIYDQYNTTQQDPIFHLLFNDGLQNALPRIAEILMNTAMWLERGTHVGAAPFQRGVERNGYANGFKSRSFQTGIGALKLSVPQVRKGDPVCSSAKCPGIRRQTTAQGIGRRGYQSHVQGRQPRSRQRNEQRTYGNAFYEEWTTSLPGSQLILPSGINEDFLAAMLSGERRLGHRMV
jgi:hypothetical protein